MALYEQTRGRRLALLLRVGAKQKQRGMLKIIISGYKNFLFHFLKRIYKCVFVCEDDLELLILLFHLLRAGIIVGMCCLAQFAQC